LDRDQISSEQTRSALSLAGISGKKFKESIRGAELNRILRFPGQSAASKRQRQSSTDENERTNKPAPVHNWYVAFAQAEGQKCEHYIRTTKTFSSEDEAKQFARERVADGCNVSAGTLNPYRPRRTIGPAQLESWLEASSM
jgi:hypothetical protein